MKPALEFLIPGALASGTGGYVYDRHVIEGLRALGWQVTVHALDGSFPQPSAAALAHAADVLSQLRDGALVLIDGLALGAMPELIETHTTRLGVVALVHMPLAAEVGLEPTLAARLQQQELQALRRARHVIVTSRASEHLLTAQGLAPASISVIEPGTDPAALARRSYDESYRLLCVATVNEGKGHELLIEALTPLADLSWELSCVGSLTRSRSTAERLRAVVRRSGLQARVQLLGELPHAQLSKHYAAADLFVLATRQESYCMGVAEALAHGLPVISTRTGAIPELVGPHAGILVEPGDRAALSAALGRVLRHPALARQLASAALGVRSRLEPWSTACAQLHALLGPMGRSIRAAARERAE